MRKTMKKAYDIVIIGGGITGCALAFELAKRGRGDILLLESQYLTSGATGRCAAGIRQQWGTRTNTLLARDSIRIFERLEEYTGYDGDCGLHQGGYLILAYSDKEWRQFNKNVEMQRSLGIDVKTLSPLEAKEVVPHLNTAGLTGATFCASDGHADPFHCTFAYAKAAQRLGVHFADYTEALGIDEKDGRVKGVRTSAGYVETENVINCAGPHAAAIAKMAGIDLPVLPERHQIMITEPVAPMQEPMVISFSHHIYCQQTPHGSFIMGMGDPSEPVSFNIQPSWQFAEECAQKVISILPPLARLAVVRQWAGLYDMSPDRNPIIDRLMEGFYVVAGFSGHGFMVAPQTAVLLAQKLTGETPSMDIGVFGLKRFAAGELLLEPSVV